MIVGYINFSITNNEEDDVIEVATRNTVNDINLGDVELVNSEPENENLYNSGIVPNDESMNSVENTVTEDKSDYFTETRIERDRMYSETIETYQKMVESSETPQEQKAIAAQEISSITTMKNAIMISENLIKNKGFDDVVILENQKIVNVIVKANSLNKEQISKIQNIVERELNVDIANINITNK